MSKALRDDLEAVGGRDEMTVESRGAVLLMLAISGRRRRTRSTFEMLESLFEDNEDVTAASHLCATVLSVVPSTVAPLTLLSYPSLLMVHATAYSVSGC